MATATNPVHAAHFHVPVVEIIHAFDEVASASEGSAKTLKLISASEAFRRYNWLRGVPMLNSADNLRGMVISARWRAIFETSSDFLDSAAKIAMIASFVANVADQWHSVDTVVQSNDTPFLKVLRLTSIAGTAAERALAGVVSSGASLVFNSLQGYCEMAGLVGSKGQSFAQTCSSRMQQSNATVQTTFRTWTDTMNQAEAIYWVSAKITSLFIGRPAGPAGGGGGKAY